MGQKKIIIGHLKSALWPFTCPWASMKCCYSHTPDPIQAVIPQLDIHMQLSSGARRLNFDLSHHSHDYLVCSSNESSDETVHLCMLVHGRIQKIPLE